MRFISNLFSEYFYSIWGEKPETFQTILILFLTETKNELCKFWIHFIIEIGGHFRNDLF